MLLLISLNGVQLSFPLKAAVLDGEAIRHNPDYCMHRERNPVLNSSRCPNSSGVVGQSNV